MKLKHPSRKRPLYPSPLPSLPLNRPLFPWIVVRRLPIRHQLLNRHTHSQRRHRYLSRSIRLPSRSRLPHRLPLQSQPRRHPNRSTRRPLRRIQFRSPRQAPLRLLLRRRPLRNRLRYLRPPRVPKRRPQLTRQPRRISERHPPGLHPKPCRSPTRAQEQLSLRHRHPQRTRRPQRTRHPQWVPLCTWPSESKS